MGVILQHCYFKAPLFHYKTLFNSSWVLYWLQDESNLKYLLFDLNTPPSPRNIRGLVLEGFIDGHQNSVWRSEMLSASL